MMLTIYNEEPRLIWCRRGSGRCDGDHRQDRGKSTDVLCLIGCCWPCGHVKPDSLKLRKSHQTEVRESHFAIRPQL